MITRTISQFDNVDVLFNVWEPFDLIFVGKMKQISVKYCKQKCFFFLICCILKKKYIHCKKRFYWKKFLNDQLELWVSFNVQFKQVFFFKKNFSRLSVLIQSMLSSLEGTSISLSNMPPLFSLHSLPSTCCAYLFVLYSLSSWCRLLARRREYALLVTGDLLRSISCRRSAQHGEGRH